MSTTLVAHRGLDENHLRGFKKAYETFTLCECDIHETADNVLVVCHDDTIACMLDDVEKSTGNCAVYTTPIRELNYAAIAPYVATLDALIAIVPENAQLFIEIKPETLSTLAYDKLTQIVRGHESRYPLMSFYLQPLCELKRRVPACSALFLMVHSQEAAPGLVSVATMQAVVSWVQAHCALKLDAVGLPVDLLDVTPASMAALHASHVRVHGYYARCDVTAAKTQVQHVITCGIDWINVDYPVHCFDAIASSTTFS